MRQHTNCFIYFAKMPDGLVKIGSTTQVRQRVQSLKGELIFLMEGSCFRETALHFLLRNSRVHGEYFVDSEEVRSFIEGVKFGDMGGLVSDVPRPELWLQTDPYRYKRSVDRPSKVLREGLGITHEQMAEEAGIAVTTARKADADTAPYFLSGRVVQYLCGKARDAGIMVDSHHLTGYYCAELKHLIETLSEKDAA